MKEQEAFRVIGRTHGCALLNRSWPERSESWRTFPTFYSLFHYSAPTSQSNTHLEIHTTMDSSPYLHSTLFHLSLDTLCLSHLLDHSIVILTDHSENSNNKMLQAIHSTDDYKTTVIHMGVL